ncbi:uncharacterized protein LOC128300261 [Anopheles moucheti]|uniref:uncharacterized protein LOC128300261 n=1 Tax=Anopheles moucheti TaxID=186751 RepID=UPI0022F0F4B3|nr:uncharacterized protein LOC128300261 [Anopheles moucheti]
MDGTGSTVVIYKTEAGDRLVLRTCEAAAHAGKCRSSRMHPTNHPLAIVRNVDEGTSGPVMIIDEPSAGASFGTKPDAIDCNTPVTATTGAETTVDSWAKILLHTTSHGGVASNRTNELMQTSNDVRIGQSTTTHNYHLRFQVKMPGQSSKPA